MSPEIALYILSFVAALAGLLLICVAIGPWRKYALYGLIVPLMFGTTTIAAMIAFIRLAYAFIPDAWMTFDLITWIGLTILTAAGSIYLGLASARYAAKHLRRIYLKPATPEFVNKP